MTRQDIINEINVAAQDNSTYAPYLVNTLSKMQPYQQEYFINKVAPYYLYGPGRDGHGMMYKDMTYMANAIAQNKDVSNVLGMDYRKLGSILQSLPDLQQTYRPQQHRSDAEIIQNINKLIHKHVLHTGEMKIGIENSMFCQSANIEAEKLPVQGWKFHISARNLQDYERLLEKLCPEFDALGIDFKVVRPERLIEQINSSQIGKAVTIYPSPAFDINKFSPELRSILSQDGLRPNGESQIQGRIYARYGKFRGGLVAQDGHVEQDIRHQRTAPDFVREHSPQQVLNFYSDCARRYAETNDAKTYLQEMATMTQGNGRSNAFVTLAINPNDKNNAAYALKGDPNKNSFVYNLNGQYYAMVHSHQADKLIERLNDMCVNYVRPDWDKRCNVYSVHPNDAGKVEWMVDEFNRYRNQQKDSPSMSLVQMGDGTIGVKVDTTLDRIFLDGCNNNQIRVRQDITNELEVKLRHPQINLQHNETDIDRC